MFTNNSIIDYARIRAYPYDSEVLYAITSYLLDHMDENDVVEPIHLPRKAENLPAWNALLEARGPWVSAYGNIVLNPLYRIQRREDWMYSVSQRSVRKAVADCSSIHGNPGGFPLDNAANFTDAFKDAGARGEDLSALAMAHYADGLHVLNSVMWPKHDRYDFDHMVTAGNRIAILDSKFYSKLKEPVVLAGAGDIPEDDIAAWEEKKNAPRRARMAARKADEARGVKYSREHVAREAKWWPNWDGLYVNGVLGSVAPVDGMRHLTKRFQELGIDVEVAVFTGFNTPGAEDPTFEVRGEPVSHIGSIREMAKAAADWVREARDEADPAIVAELHSRLKEGGCISEGCDIKHPDTA